MKAEYCNGYKQIGFKIKTYRKKAGLTQEQLAEKVGKSTTFISHLEAPGIFKAPSLDTLMDIAKALDVPLYKLTEF